MMPLVKQVYMPLDVNKIEETIHEACYLATTGRGGPVVIDIPKDVQIRQTAEDYKFNPAGYEPDLPGFLYHPVPNRDSISKAVALIDQCETPIILCGHGVISSNQGDRLRRFAEMTNIPIGFTLHGLSAVPMDHLGIRCQVPL